MPSEIFSDGIFITPRLKLVLIMTIIRTNLVNIKTNYEPTRPTWNPYQPDLQCLRQMDRAAGSDYNLFAVLYTLATEGSRTQKHIGEEWSLSKQTVSGVCKTLAGQGLIEWQEGEQDRRERLLSLTEKGKAHAAPLTESAQEFSDKVFATFGDKRTTRLFADLDALAEVMEKIISENKK